MQGGHPHLLSCSIPPQHLVQRAHELDDRWAENRSDVELAIVAAHRTIRMAGQRVPDLLVYPGFTALRDKAMPPGMVGIETTVVGPTHLPAPFVDPLGGRAGAPAKSIGRYVWEQQPILRQAGDIPHEPLFDKHRVKRYFAIRALGF